VPGKPCKPPPATDPASPCLLEHLVLVSRRLGTLGSGHRMRQFLETAMA
jgi:hypothetical protein